MSGKHLNCQDVMDSYESLVKELTQELYNVQSAHDDLKSQLSSVLNENRELTQELGRISKPTLNENELVGNLRAQIKSLLAEKEYLSSLWRESTTTIQVLERELDVYQAGSTNFVPKNELEKMKQIYEEKIDTLKRKTDKEKTGVEKVVEVRGGYENHAEAMKIVKNLEEEILALQKRLQDSERARGKVEKSLKEKEENILNLTKTNREYRDKVSEAVQVVEAALHEKDAALFRENQMKEQMLKLNSELSNLMNEADEKIKNETDKLRFEHEKNLESIRIESRKFEEELKLKILETEKLSVKCSLLENQIEKFQKGNFSIDESCANKLLILEKNLESTFQKLLVSEKQNIQLSSEKATIKNDMEQMAEHYERTLKTKEIEKTTLVNKTKQLQFTLDESNSTLTQLKQQLQTVNEEWKLAQENWRKREEEQANFNSKKLQEEIDKMRQRFDQEIVHLTSCLETKDNMHKKWTQETKTIIDNLEKLVGDLKSELHSLKKENKKLKAELKESKCKADQYKQFLQVVSTDVDRITVKAAG